MSDFLRMLEITEKVHDIINNEDYHEVDVVCDERDLLWDKLSKEEQQFASTYSDFLLHVADMERAIRKVVTQRADNVCWRDAYLELGKLVGIEVTPESLALLPFPQMMKNCEAFCHSIRAGAPYETDFATKQIMELKKQLADAGGKKE